MLQRRFSSLLAEFDQRLPQIVQVFVLQQFKPSIGGGLIVTGRINVFGCVSLGGLCRLLLGS